MEQSGIAFGNRAPLVSLEPIAGRRSILKDDDPSSTQVISQVPTAEQYCARFRPFISIATRKLEGRELGSN